MNCADARDLMLEAETDALTGTGEYPLALHIASCEECRGVAAGLVADARSVRSALLGMSPGVRAVDVARRAMAGSAATPSIINVPPARWRRSAARFGVRMVAIAAAAAVVLVLAGKRKSVAPESGSVNVLPDSSAATIAVEVPEGKNVIVFETKNPLVSVVWIY